MTLAIVVGCAAVLVALRYWRRARRSGAHHDPWRVGARSIDLHGAPLVAARELRERVRGRPFRIGTALILLAVAAAIVIPILTRGTPTPTQVGIVGPATPQLRAAIHTAAAGVGTSVHVVVEPSASAARDALERGRLDVALLGDRAVVVATLDPTGASSSTQLATALAGVLGVHAAYRAAGLSPAQIARLAGAKPITILSLQPATKPHNAGSSVIGVILVFLMLTQYNTWILLGVMEEKSSRVVEVLLATVRPIQLLAGKVFGIGLVALGQATLIVSFALVLGAIVGSNLLHGAAPIELAAALLWLVLGYGFYCWAYAAAASMAERQDQIQSVALPLSIPILIGYVFSLTVAGSGNASPFFKVLAYLPPTAPFAMPVLVGLDQVSILGFATSVVISLLCTVGVARLAAVVYRRAILRTGSKVRLRDVLRTAH
ncbi:MAG TPA: ABC transporter permease [Acidimicrobiales bacterium]|jgi:ABC-2 type transport system permease protein|nr:ABC transporter permease [Acidimicrobiales bacterium]